MKPTQRKHPESPNVYADFDNGRRGEPKPGCDCVQCFGRCLSDNDHPADLGSGRSLFDASMGAAE